MYICTYVYRDVYTCIMIVMISNSISYIEHSIASIMISIPY